MDLIDTQTFGFIIAFLVTFAALVIAFSKRFPNENIRRSTQRTKVPVRLEDQDQPLLRYRRPTTILRAATPIMTSVGTQPLRPPLSTPGAPIPPADPPSPTQRTLSLPPTPHTPTTIAPSPATKATTSPIRGPTQTPQATTCPSMPPISTPRAPTPTLRAPTPLDTPPTPTPRAPTSPPRALTPTSRAPTPTAMPPISTPRAPTPTPRTPRPLVMPPTPTPRAPTPPAMPPTPTPRAPTSPAMKPTPTPRAPTSPAMPTTPTPRAPTSPARAPTPTPRAPTSPARAPTPTPNAPTPPAMPPTPTPRAPTSPAMPPTPTPRAPSSPAMQPTSTPRAPTSPARTPTPTPKAPSPTAMPPLSTLRAPTPTPRAPTPPARAPTPPPVTPIQQQADMAQQLAKEQEEMAAQSTELEMEVWRKVIDQNTRKLKTYLIPDEIIDLDTGFKLFSFTDRRDIKEEKNTTNKNEAILTKIRSKGDDAYKDFKERLKITNQSKLADLLTYSERELSTDEIEQQLDKMLAEQITRTVYDKQKRDLKCGLVEFYKTRHSKVFLSPLFEEKDTPLASFYIRPELSSIVSTSTRNDKNIPVKSLSEIFKSDNTENREIYVLADAGLGKTAFSKYLANVWCQAHYPDEKMTDVLSKDDIDCMQGFDFLFLVLLRDSDDLCSIDDLIFEKNVLFLGLEEKLPENVLLKILKNEKCLVILDGLDEWTHPDKKCYRLPRSIPHRNDRKKCTVMTTTRPWKLGVLDLNSCQLGTRVALTQLSEASAVTLIERIIQKWKSHPNKDALDSDVLQFIEAISQRENDELAFVPLLLIYTTCLWCGGVQIGDSRCDLYINIVELLLSKTIQMHGELQQSWELSSIDIPECFADYDNCTKYYPLLMHIGKLAYYTLFNETKENTLVFDGLVARKYLAQDEMNFTLHSGMLSESTSKTARKKISKVSFSHKTVQEFFAAIFISSQNDAQKTVLEKCRNVQDILDMSKVCEFISKMNTDQMCAISNDWMSVINEDEETRDYRTRQGYQNMHNTPLYNIQEMFMSCLQKMPESVNIQLYLQHFFINENTEHSEQLQRLLKQNKTNINSLHINISRNSSSLREIIYLFSLTDLSHIQKLHYRGDIGKEAEINQILFPSLQYVTLLYGNWTNDAENMSENMAQCKNLQYLHIGDFRLSHKILETLFNFISGQKSMKELILVELDCKEHAGHDCKRLNLDLSQNPTLSKLNLQRLPGGLQLNISTPSLVSVKLWGINLHESSLLLSMDMQNIEHVELEKIKMSVSRLQNFFTVLENLPQSVTVQMSAIEPETKFQFIQEKIRYSQTFCVIGNLLHFTFKTIKPSKE